MTPEKKSFDFRIENPAKVYFIPLSPSDNNGSIAEKTRHLLRNTGFSSFIEAETTVAVKQHFGEEGNCNYIKPPITKEVVSYIKEARGFPLLVETNTLYKGNRSDTYNHLLLAHSHGFSVDNIGAPVHIMDGINGQNQHQIVIPGNHFKSVYMVPDLPFFNSMFVLSHVKGHLLSGMGGALKNLAMGFASRAGKLSQHDEFLPAVDKQKCVSCLLCTKYCPTEAIYANDTTVAVDSTKCIGCGECYTACRYGAISMNWGSEGRVFQEKMVEHACGAVINHPRKIAYLNFVYDIAKHCDCWGEENPVLYQAVGIFASYDPVAIDKASIDSARNVFGKDIFKEMWPEIDASVQLRYGETIGIGTQKYELIEIESSVV